MLPSTDEIFRRLQTAGKALSPEVVTAFAGPVSKNVDRFLAWALVNKRISAEAILRGAGPFPAVEEFVMSLSDLKESSRRVYESRLRTYAHHSMHFIPQLPRTSQLLRNDPHFVDSALQVLGSDLAEAVVNHTSKRFAVVFSSPHSTLVLNDLARHADRDWFNERRSRFSKSGAGVARTQAASALRQLSLQLEEIAKSDLPLKALLASLRSLPEVVSVHAEGKKGLQETINDAVADLLVQAQLLESRE